MDEFIRLFTSFWIMAFAVLVGIFVMIYGWGIEPESYAWIVFGTTVQVIMAGLGSKVLYK